MGRLVGAFFVALALGPLAMGQTQSTSVLDQLKPLAGEWEGTMPDGTKVRTVYRLTAGGSALVETMDPGGPHEMVTVYYPDGKRIMLTHYCMAKNQPRMAAIPSEQKPNEFDFHFVDVTNLASPRDSYMRDLVLMIRDTDHMTQKWTYHKDGKDQQPTVFEYTRKK